MDRFATVVHVALVAGLLAVASPVVAQAPPATAPADSPIAPIATDRPGNGNAPTTVPQWRLQVETSVGYAYARASSGDGHLVNFPTALRFGVLEYLELRVATGAIGIDARPPRGGHVANPTDTSVGTKLQVLGNDGWKPSLGVVVDVFFPSGRGAFTGEVVVPDARIAASWSLPWGFGLLFNAGIDVPRDPEGRFARLVYVGNLNYAPPAVGGRLSFFIETFGRIPLAAERGRVIQVDVGAAFLLATDWQIDIFTQHALTNASPDFQVAFGLSTRI